MMLTDGHAALVANNAPVGPPRAGSVVEGYAPFRTVFDVTWSGRRHVVMGASQIDRFGNQNISAIGPPSRPSAQLLGLRGAPGNAINHTVTYWIPNHSRRVFVDHVDIVCAPGYDRLRDLPPASSRSFEIRRVVSNLGVFDFATHDNTMRLVSRHPGVAIDEILRATAFDLEICEATPQTRVPSSAELDLLRNEIDPRAMRRSDFPELAG